MNNPALTLLEQFSPLDAESHSAIFLLASQLTNLEKSEGRMVWYPDSGFDFSDLLFYSPAQCEKRQSKSIDLFVHTDFSDENFQENANPQFYQELQKFMTLDVSTIAIKHVIPLVTSGLDANEPDRSTFANLLAVSVRSVEHGRFLTPMLFIHAESTTFESWCKRLEIKIDEVYEKP